MAKCTELTSLPFKGLKCLISGEEKQCYVNVPLQM